MTPGTAPLAVALFLVTGAARCFAGQLVVVEARGIGLQPGAALDDGKPVVLQEGQHLTLIAANGVTLKLDGPYNQVPEVPQSGDVIQLAINALVTQQGARSEIGATRAGRTTTVLPDPWLIDVSQSGTVCLLEGQQPIFWRPSAAVAAEMSVWPTDRSWRAHATWPAGSDRLLIPETLPVHGGATYLISLNGSEQVAVTVSLVPANLSSIPMRAAWMAHQRCEAQAEALLRQAR